MQSDQLIPSLASRLAGNQSSDGCSISSSVSVHLFLSWTLSLCSLFVFAPLLLLGDHLADDRSGWSLEHKFRRFLLSLSFLKGLKLILSPCCGGRGLRKCLGSLSAGHHLVIFCSVLLLPTCWPLFLRHFSCWKNCWARERERERERALAILITNPPMSKRKRGAGRQKRQRRLTDWLTGQRWINRQAKSSPQQVPNHFTPNRFAQCLMWSNLLM